LNLTPEIIIKGYTLGIFPMAMEDEKIYWFEPKMRGIINLNNLIVSKSLAKLIRNEKFKVTINKDFKSIIKECSKRDDTWISNEIIDVYSKLHELNFAHSVECWLGDELCGGLYGVAIGGAFFGESMFHTITNASKVALVFLVDNLIKNGFTLLDTQYLTPHLESMGGIEITKREYLKRLNSALIIKAKFE
jgi:leucyl/phenylalanyl-tRNA--protein transferase